MPWISQKLDRARSQMVDELRERNGRLSDDTRRLAVENRALREANLMLEAGVLNRLDTLPQAVVDACLADVLTRASLRADGESQPLSIEAANKARVRDLREAAR